MPSKYEIRKDALTLTVAAMASLQSATPEDAADWVEYFQYQLTEAAKADAATPKEPTTIRYTGARGLSPDGIIAALAGVSFTRADADKIVDAVMARARLEQI